MNTNIIDMFSLWKITSVSLLNAFIHVGYCDYSLTTCSPLCSSSKVHLIHTYYLASITSKQINCFTVKL